MKSSGFSHFLLSFCILLPFVQGAAAAESACVAKNSGVCFRFDDNHPVNQWKDLAGLFRRFGFPLNLAVNSESLTPESGKLLAALAKDGNEIMDHTPGHAVYQLRCRTGAEFEAARKLPFVAETRPGAKWLFFGYEFNPKYPGNLRCVGTVHGNELTVADPRDRKRIHHLGKVYLPDGGKVYGIRLEGGKCKLYTFWGTGGVDLNLDGKEMILCSDLAFHPAPGVVAFLAERARKQFTAYGIPAPRTWCQPGGWEPCLTVETISRIYGKEFGYCAASCVPQVWPWVNCFNDPNPERYRFAMRPSDNTFDGFDVFAKGKTLAEVEKRIADCVAKHRVQILLSHMKADRIPGGWEAWLDRYGQLLAWLQAKKVPVRTVAEWSEILYSQKPDPWFNIMPALTTDLDSDSVPDGYRLEGKAAADVKAGTLRLDRGGSASIDGLAGIEKGMNRFSILCKGKAGTRVVVDFSPIRHRVTHPSTTIRKVFRLTADAETAYPAEVEIPKDTVVMNVRFSSSGPAELQVPEFRRAIRER